VTEANSDQSANNGFLFTVEVYINGRTNGIALEKLTQVLNSPNVIDYRINKGINLGQVIDAAVKVASKNKEKLPLPQALDAVSTVKKETKDQKLSAAKASSVKQDFISIIDQIGQYKENNTLVRLSIVKGKGVKMNLPCRVLNYDLASGNITVYHVDEKKVYTFQINEIEDLQS
jgi:hypothetical protein